MDKSKHEHPDVDIATTKTKTISASFIGPQFRAKAYQEVMAKVVNEILSKDVPVTVSVKEGPSTLITQNNSHMVTAQLWWLEGTDHEAIN